MLKLLELQQKLSDKFSNSGFDASDLLLNSPGVSETCVSQVESVLGVKFPLAFVKLVTTFDFSRLNLGGLYFSYRDDLASLQNRNIGEANPWYGPMVKPEARLFVASTDGHLVLISTDDGHLESILVPFTGSTPREVIAQDFEDLVLIAGAIALGDIEDGRLVSAISRNPGGFWQQLADGTA